MSQSEDPRAALKSGDVTTRAAAARDLARAGSWDDLSVLVHMAKSDKSPSVRLYTAAAACDIAARFRGAAGQTRMTPQQAVEVQDWLKSFDPIANPSLLMMLSAVADASSIKRLGRMLRDPRSGVRTGAATALRRMAVSAAALGDDALAEAVRGWLNGKKLTADATLELLKLASEVGWTGLDDALRLVAGAGRPHGPAYEEYLRRKVARGTLETWEGLWCADGADALCAPTEDAVTDWIAIWDNVAFRRGGPQVAVELDAEARIGGEPFRFIWTDRVGESTEIWPAIQGRGVTYYRVEGKALVPIVDTLGAELGPAGVAVAGWLEAVDGALATRARAIALWSAGELDGSLEILGTLISHKRPRNDLFYWLARVQADRGDKSAARKAIDTFMEKAGKKSALRSAGEALREQLR